MTFMNKKEEVIDIELTQYGKYKLAQGKFMPHYYAFYDDNILYNSEFGGITEESREAQERIQTTPQRNTQYCFVSLDKQVKQLTSVLRNLQAEINDEELQNYKEREYVFPMPLGTSSYDLENAPAWSVNFLKGEIGSFTTHITKTEQIIRIPQVEVQPITYETQIFLEDDKPVSSPAPGLDTLLYEDGSYVEIFGDCLLMSIDEYNTEFENENFELEVFSVETESVQEGGQTVRREKLIPLSFLKERPNNIVNGILVDTDEEDFEQSIDFSSIDESYVEYWFDIFTDHGIDQNVICANLPPKTVRGDIFRQGEFLDCPELPYYEDRISNDAESISIGRKKEEDC